MLSLLLACSSPSEALVEPASAPPMQGDRVLIVVDTLRADALHFAGNPRATSPHLDRFVAQDAAWFSRAYACSSWTLSSTATLLTGLYPWEHRVVRGTEHHVYGRLPAEVPTVASAWKQAGLSTAGFVNNTYLAPEFGLGQHFELYDYSPGDPVEHRRAAETVDTALAWLAEHPEPVGLFVHIMDPHFEYLPTPEVAGRFSAELPHTLEPPLGTDALRTLREDTPSDQDIAYLHARYDEEVVAVDAALGRLLEGLAQRPGWDRTQLVLTSDHGEEFWEQGGFEHGHTTLSPVTRVPLVVKAPGVPAGENATVLDHVPVAQALMAGEGPFYELARSGTREGGVAISQDILYGPQQITIVDAEHRLLVQPGGQNARLWKMDGQGAEAEELFGEARAAGEGLYERLIARRGDLEPTEPVEPTRLGSAEAIQQLRALGYLE